MMHNQFMFPFFIFKFGFCHSNHSRQTPQITYYKLVQ